MLGGRKQPKSLMVLLRKNLVQVEKVEINLIKRVLKPRANEETVRKGHHHFNKIIAVPCWGCECSDHLSVRFGDVKLEKPWRWMAIV